MKRIIVFVSIGSLLLLGGLAFARGGKWMGMGHHGGGMGKQMHCVKKLLHTPPEVLKEKFGLKDDQISKIQAIRMNFLNKKIDLRAELEKLRLKMEGLLQVDLPDEGQVLAMMRKIRALRGTKMEEGVKAHIKILSVMTKEQRAVFSLCFQKRWERHDWGKERPGCPCARHGFGGPGPGGM